MTESRIESAIEDFILITLLITKMMEFFGLTGLLQNIGVFPGEIAFIDVIISMTAMAYVLYQAEITEIFFGTNHKHLNLLIIFFCFFLIGSKFVEFSGTYIDEYNTMYPKKFINNQTRYELTLKEMGWTEEDFSKALPTEQDKQEFLIAKRVIYTQRENSPTNALFYSIADDMVSGRENFQLTSFIIGSILLILISIYITFKVDIINPSIVGALLGEHKNILLKFSMVFTVIMSFHLLFFNFVMEWLTVVIDAPVILIAIILYVFKVHGVGKSLGSEEILHKIADAIENNVEKFTSLFHSRNTILLGLAGILILHLVADMGAFVIPNIIPTESAYESKLDSESHMKLFELFSKDKEIIQDKFVLILGFFGYVINTIALILLMVFPIFIWYSIYSAKTSEDAEPFIISSAFIAIFYSTVFFYVFMPVFKIISYKDYSLARYGTDIQTQSIFTSGNSIFLIFSLAVLILIAILILCMFDSIKKILFYAMTIIAIFFFGFYVFCYSYSLILYYANLLSDFFSAGQFFVLFMYVLFLIISIIFYMGGYLSFLVSVFKSD
jgi:hypothetical protein